MAIAQNPKSEIPECESQPLAESALVADARRAPRVRLARALRIAPVLLLIALTLAPRLYLYNPTRAITRDAIDYANIARNLVSHRGFTHTIKWHFFTNDPVIHSAIGERPPPVPLLPEPVDGTGRPTCHHRPGQHSPGRLGYGSPL